LAIADLSSSTSSLLNDVLMQIEFQRSGRYQDPDDFTLDWGGRGQTGVRRPRHDAEVIDVDLRSLRRR
jgi:hypothetical protein